MLMLCLCLQGATICYNIRTHSAFILDAAGNLVVVYLKTGGLLTAWLVCEAVNTHGKQ